jgi:hypothetical protein
MRSRFTDVGEPFIEFASRVAWVMHAFPIRWKGIFYFRRIGMHRRWTWRLIALLLFGALVLLVAPAALAAGPDGAPATQQADNAACLACHGNPNLSVKLPSGETLPLFIDQAKYGASVHGKQGQKCTACHTKITGYPHPAITVKDLRDFQLQMYNQCQQCHAKNYEQALDSIHGQEIKAGDRNAAVCTDCHGSHYITPPDQPRSKIPQTCEKCHSTIYNQYKTSVHGAALLDQSNPDVPTCVDCHGVHTIVDPTTAAFRLKSPEICANCHTDKTRMAKYSLSTDVLATYVADFHGTTVQLFEKQSPDAPTNKAVCYDCHGVHDIRKVDDPQSTVFRDNLVKTCERCHPGASANFPASWLMHYSPSPTKFPLVYYVNLFYTIFIPVVLAVMILIILTDIYRHTRQKSEKAGRA